VNSNPIRFLRPRRSAAVSPERRSPALSEPAFSPGEEHDAATPTAQEAGSIASVVGEAPRAERLVPAPAIPDRGTTWRRAATIAASVLLHIGVILLILARFPSEGPQAPPPIPVELATLPPPKPQPQVTPTPKPRQPQPERRSGGDLENRKYGALPPAQGTAEKPPLQTQLPAPPAPEPPSQKPAPELRASSAEKSAPVAPPAAPRQTQQAAIPTPIPPTKPPEPKTRQAALPSPSAEQPSKTPPNPAIQLGEGGGDRYLNSIRDDIKRNFYYPPTAELFGIAGVATYDITLARDG
jgi:outer membrane biosynthesis protein TonB